MPDAAAELKAMVVAYEAEIRARDLLIEKLKHQLAGLRRHRFGAKSEALDQLELLLEGEEIVAAANEAKIERSSRQEPKGQPKCKPLPDHLPREEQVIGRYRPCPGGPERAESSFWHPGPGARCPCAAARR